jgi:hypothetical protein
MSLWKAAKKLGSAAVQTALLPLDLAIDSTGAGVLREKGGPFSFDRGRRIGRDLVEAYKETTKP